MHAKSRSLTGELESIRIPFERRNIGVSGVVIYSLLFFPQIYAPPVMTTSAQDSIVLLGDSITQDGWSPYGFAQRLASEQHPAMGLYPASLTSCRCLRP